MVFKFLFYLIFLFPVVFASPEIKEINFIDSEYVEIFSNTSFNLTNSKIFKFNDSDYNMLTPYKIYNSSLYLIAGQSFIEEQNTSQLNCSIYVTDRSQVAYGGLKSNGEDFFIENNSSNLSINIHLNKSYDFLSNESLNFASNLTHPYIGNRTPCQTNLPPEISPLDNSSHKNSSNSSMPVCSSLFEIKTPSIIQENKLTFSFRTDASNYSITYWVENYFNSIVKEKRQTQSLSSKVFTPPITGVYKVFAELEYGNCIFRDEKDISVVKLDQEKDDEKITNSKIKILDKEELENRETQFLELEIYRGDTRKRVVWIYLDNKKLTSLETNKFSSIKSRVFLPITKDEHSILIEGLDQEVSFSINKVPQKDQNKEKTNEESFNIRVLQNISPVKFRINSTFEQVESICYIVFIRTKMSEEIKINNSGDYFLEINTSKLVNKDELESYDLKLTCKYKKPELKTYNYVHEDFFFELENITTQSNSFENISEFFSSSNNELLIKTPEEKTAQNYISKNSSLKENSFMFIALGLTIIVFIVIFNM